MNKKLLNKLNIKEDEVIGVTVSGGKDSIYVWLKLVEEFGPEHVRAFSFIRPGITHDLAIKNIKQASMILKSPVDFITDTKGHERLKKNSKILLENLDPAAIRVILCAGCRFGISKQLYNYGNIVYGITKFVNGASAIELAPFKEELIKNCSASNDINEGFENLLKKYPTLDYEDNLEVIKRDHTLKHIDNDTKENLIKDNNWKVIDFFAYENYNPIEIENYVKEKVKWTHPGRSWHFDCKIERLKDKLYRDTLGYTEYDCKLKAMVEAGLITQEEADRKLLSFNKSVDNTLLDEILRELNI